MSTLATIAASPFIQLPPKAASSLKLAPALEKFLSKQFGSDTAQQFQEAISAIQQRRNELLNLQERSEGGKDLCLKYACDLLFLHRHFPINSGTNRIRFNFSWYDAFNKRNASQGNIFYEQACVLFNAAVFEGQLGAAESRTSNASVLNAAKYFQASAGIFQYIKDVVSPHIVERITPDVSAECLECLASLMLAHAQQCVVEKAVLGGMKLDSISKLSAECSAMYANSLALMKSANLSSLFDRSTLGYVQCKTLYYDAFANLCLANLAEENHEKGIQLARLYKIRELITEAKGCKISPEFKQSVTAFKEECKRQTASAEKDNQKVYHDRIPKYDDLDPIEKKRLVKTKKIESLEEETGSVDSFKELFPIPVMESQQKYRESLNLKLNSAFRHAREHRDSIKGRLTENGLPGSIMANETQAGFPPKIHASVEKIRSEGGINRLRNLRVALSEMADETAKQCEKISEMLQEEASEDARCRQQYVERWNRLPSQQLTVNLKRQLTTYQEKISQASNSDKLVDQKIQDNEDVFRKFELSREELDQIMPRPDSNASTQVTQLQSELQQMLARLDDLLGEEKNIERELLRKQEENVESIKSDLLERQGDMDSVIHEHLASYDPALHKLKELGDAEESLFSEIKSKNAQFTNGKNDSSTTQLRQNSIQRMFNGINKYDEIMANIREGIQFYSSMQDFIKKLRQRVEDFIFARQTEKQDLISNLFSNMSMQSHQQQPYQQQQQYGQQYQQSQHQYNQQPPQQPQQYYQPPPRR